MDAHNKVNLVVFCPRDIHGGAHNYWLNLLAERGFIDNFRVDVVAQSSSSTAKFGKQWSAAIGELIEYPADGSFPIWNRIDYHLPGLRRCRRMKALRECIGRQSQRPIVWFILDGFFSIGWCSKAIQHCIDTDTRFHLIVQHVPEFAFFLSQDLQTQAVGLFSSATRVVFVSRRNWQSAEDCLGCRLSNAELGVNGLTEATFDRAYQLGTRLPPKISEDLSIINLARFDVAYKRQDLLIRAIADLKAIYSYINAVFVGGFGSDRWFLENLVRYFELADGRIRFVDSTDDPIEMLASHDLFALTSESEGMAFAMVEAAASCRPLLATDVAGAPELVIEGETGYLAEAVTPNAVKNALERAILDRSNWVNRGKAAHHLAREKHCLRRLVPILRDNALKDLSL